MEFGEVFIMKEINWESLTPTEKKKALYEKQKELLDTFRKRKPLIPPFRVVAHIHGSAVSVVSVYTPSGLEPDCRSYLFSGIIKAPPLRGA